MLESKIDETNNLLHKLANEVFPTIFHAFESLDSRMEKLEERMNRMERNLAEDKVAKPHSVEHRLEEEEDTDTDDSKEETSLEATVTETSPEPEHELKLQEEVASQLMLRESEGVMRDEEVTDASNTKSALEPVDQEIGKQLESITGDMGQRIEAMSNNLEALEAREREMENEKEQRTNILKGQTREQETPLDQDFSSQISPENTWETLLVDCKYQEVVILKYVTEFSQQETPMRFEGGALTHIDNIPVICKQETGLREEISDLTYYQKQETYETLPIKINGKQSLFYQRKLNNNKELFYIRFPQQDRDVAELLQNDDVDVYIIEYPQEMVEQMEVSEESLEIRRMEKLLLALSKEFIINDFDDIFTFFSIGDTLFEDTSFEYQKICQKPIEWPKMEFSTEGLQRFIVDLFNMKFSQWVDDRRIVVYIESCIHKEYPKSKSIDYTTLRSYFPVDMFNKRTSMIKWEPLLMRSLIRNKYKDRGKEFLIKYIDVLADRKNNLIRQFYNFKALILLLQVLPLAINEFSKVTGRFALQSTVILCKIYDAFQFEIDYLMIFETRMKDFQRFKVNNQQLYSSAVSICGFSIPQQWSQFIHYIDELLTKHQDMISQCLKDDIDVSKQGTLDAKEQISQDINSFHIKHQSQLRRYRFNYSRRWDKFHSQDLFYFSFFNIEFVLTGMSVAKEKYYRYLKYEVCEYFNLVPLAAMVVVASAPELTVEDKMCVQEDLLCFAAHLLIEPNIISSFGIVVRHAVQSINYHRYLEGKEDIEAQMMDAVMKVFSKNRQAVVKQAEQFARRADQVRQGESRAVNGN